MKIKSKLPTVEQFLSYVPMRGDFSWNETDDGLIHITVPKFTSRIGIFFCTLLRKQNTFTANLDKYGSFIWKLCDGKTSVREILDQLKKEYPHEKNIDQRLFLFLRQMQSLQYLSF